MCIKPNIYYALFTLMQGGFMKTDQIIPSVLTVCANLCTNISDDLQKTQTKSIAKLLEEKDEEKNENDQNTNG